AMAEAELHLLHAAPLVGVWQDRLGEERQLLGEDGRFALARLAEGPLDADEVAEVEFVSELPAEVADLLLADEDLHLAGPVENFGLFVFAFDFALGGLGDRLAGPVPEIEEVDLPLDASAGDAARRLDAWTFAFRRVGGKLEDGVDRLMAIEALPP